MSFFLFFLQLGSGIPKSYWSHPKLHSHKERKDSLETWAVLLISLLELEISGVAIQTKVAKNTKNGGFCEELLSENNFEAVLATFCCYDFGANASEAIQKISTDQKDYYKCSSCVIVC